LQKFSTPQEIWNPGKFKLRLARPEDHPISI
jgi:hypothetical protein